MPKSTAIKWPGSKTYLSDWLLSLAPPKYTTLLDATFGGGALPFKVASTGEPVSIVVCDRSWVLTNFWWTLQDAESFKKFQQQVEIVPFSQVEWRLSQAAVKLVNSRPPDELPDWIDHEMAAAFFVSCRQSMSGRGDSFAPISTSRLRRNNNEQVSAWLSAIDGLPEVHNILQRFLILEPEKAQTLVPRYDKKGVWAYVDFPYLHETRVTKTEYGAFEMTVAEHEEALQIFDKLKHAKVLLSGYDSALYRKLLKNWNRYEKKIDNKASKKRIKDIKTEVCWANY